MTKEEAIAEIEAQAKAGVKAFQVMSMDEVDIEQYGDDDLKERFGRLAPEAKVKFMSSLIDEMHETFEEFYGFKALMDNTLQAIAIEGNYKSMFDNAEGRA